MLNAKDIAMTNFRTALAGAVVAFGLTPFAAQADQADDFGWILVAQVHAGIESSAVDAMITDIMDAARGNTGALVFNFARVGDKIYGYEMFDNEAAFFEHLSRVEPLVPQLLELWAPTSVVPTHALPENVLAVMQQMGAIQPDMAAALVH